MKKIIGKNNSIRGFLIYCIFYVYNILLNIYMCFKNKYNKYVMEYNRVFVRYICISFI